MAGPYTCHHAGKSSTYDSNIPNYIIAIFCAPILAPAQTPISAQAFALIRTFISPPGRPKRYIDNNLPKAIKLALELFVNGQEHCQIQITSYFVNRS